MLVTGIIGKNARSQIGWYRGTSVREVAMPQRSVNKPCDDLVIPVGVEGSGEFKQRSKTIKDQ